MTLAQTGAALLGGTLRQWTALHGGDLSQVVRIVLADGRTAVVKGGPAPRTEASMLTAMADSGAPAPRVLAVSDAALVLEELAADSALAGAWGSLGEALARLHAVHGSHYGWDADYAFGPVAIENGLSGDWPEFWAARRLLVHLPHVSAPIARRLEALAADLPHRLPRRPPASLLHGDLWGGNILAAGGVVTGLIDPACYFGHGEVDIAMLGLFDRPGAAFFDAYGALEPGCEARLTLYRLWPALVHLRLFGNGYRPLVEGLLAAARV